ncbi:MAG: MGMT family protein [Desulfosudis oleivorans]|nr:MGMT family protein [Desulfosudis oleivorans]
MTFPLAFARPGDTPRVPTGGPAGRARHPAREGQHLRASRRAYSGSRSAVRAVGQALATNPFPIIVPCHRAVRSSGELGGYQGGPAMKRALLEREGVAFDAAGRVVVPRFHYS